MSKSLIFGFVLSLLLVTGYIYAGNNNKVQNVVPDSLSGDQMAAYKKQAAQMVAFMEFAFNTLGSSKSEYKEKDIIINQSYLKFFKDARVQVEDDLDEKRDVVTNKDIQAYLKDIDFFYNEVVFRFTIEEITQELNEKGEIFFKVKTSRNLNGVNIEGKQINDNKPRFIEINLDEVKGELKIASIYTTRTGEEQELIGWWNSLESGWRKFFSDEILVLDSIPLKDIAGLGQDYIFILPDGIPAEDSAFYADTLKVNTAPVLSEIRRILRTERIDISGIKGIFDLEPLSAFTSLKYLNISGASVSRLEPVRNLSRLETLIASSSLIASIQPLQYCSGIRHLDISSTFVTDIGPISNFSKLETLDISGLQVDSLKAMSGLGLLRELRLNQTSVRSPQGLEKLVSLELLEISGSAIKDLSGIDKLTKLQRLSIEKTYVSDLSPLALLSSLEYIFLDYTPVSDLSPLLAIASIKAVYCDRSLVDRDEALTFMKEKPEVKVIYESEELTAWWQTLGEEWKSVFRKQVTLDKDPTREQLHELTYIKKLNFAGNRQIKTLKPLTKLTSLEELDASETGIQDIVAVNDLPNLKNLDLASVGFADLAPVAGLKSLEMLNVSFSKITDLSPLSGLRNLRVLSVSGCQVTQAAPLLKLKRMEILYAEGVTVIENVVEQLWDSIPDVLVVYQTRRLADWWSGLPEPWKLVFTTVEPVGVAPTAEQLHRIASVKVLDLSENQNLKDLHPLRMLARLENLTISRVPVADISVLSSMSRIKEFDCSNTPVTDILPLALNRKMVILNLANTQINNIDVIAGFPELKRLDISGTKVTRLNPVSQCLKLEQLDCYNTRISAIKAIEHLPNLRLLRIYNTKVSSRNIEKFRLANPAVDVVFY